MKAEFDQVLIGVGHCLLYTHQLPVLYVLVATSSTPALHLYYTLLGRGNALIGLDLDLTPGPQATKAGIVIADPGFLPGLVWHPLTIVGTTVVADQVLRIGSAILVPGKKRGAVLYLKYRLNRSWR